jgi:hypothetical protein
VADAPTLGSRGSGGFGRISQLRSRGDGYFFAGIVGVSVLEATMSLRRWTLACPEHANGDLGTEEGVWGGSTRPATRMKALARLASWTAAAWSRVR